MITKLKVDKRQWFQKFVRHFRTMWTDYQPTHSKYSLDSRTADRNSENASVQQPQESRQRPRTYATRPKPRIRTLSLA